MGHVWWLYLLVFVFVYITCKTFYFVREVRIGLVMLKISHYLSLYVLVKGVENLEYTKTLRIKEMRRNGDSDRNVHAYRLNSDQDIKLYKDKCIREVVSMHPRFYRSFFQYDNWDSAMRFLDEGGIEYIKHFHKEDNQG